MYTQVYINWTNNESHALTTTNLVHNFLFRSKFFVHFSPIGFVYIGQHIPIPPQNLCRIIAHDGVEVNYH